MHIVRERAAEFGVRGVDSAMLSFDLPAAVARKDAIVGDIIAGIHNGLERNANITFLRGHAEFTSPVDIRVDGRHITAKKVILAVGARQADAPIPGLEEAGYLTNREALQLEAVPDSMIVIGGGYVGIEFAQMYARFGTRVTILGRAPQLMRREEPELARMLADVLRAEGVAVHIGTAVIRAGVGNGLRWVEAQTPEGTHRFEGEVILLAAGRVARVEGLGLEQAGVEMDGRFIRVDETLCTSTPNIWSLGDGNGGYMFTHRATYDGPIAALNAVKSLGRKVDYRVVPRAVFTEPALAGVGMTEAEARAAGREVKVGTALFAHTGRAKAIGQTEGMVKLIADAETDELLGGHILGPRADDLIHEVAVAMHGRGTFERLSKTIHIHPTLAETVKNAAKGLR
jgi:pyruvate/2-oxoglutarate dehydrogenase complex dihydrolipoamide dehydrogenase (E3) component